MRPETHKGLKRVTRVQCSWAFTFYHFWKPWWQISILNKWLPRDHHADVLRQEFCISGLKIHRSKTKKWKEKVQQNTQLSFGGGREAFHQEIVLRRIQSRASDKANIFTFQPLMSFWWERPIRIILEISLSVRLVVLSSSSVHASATCVRVSVLLSF